MTVKELDRDQLTELKQRMVDDEIYETEGRSASYGELAAAEGIPDERAYEAYEGTEFSPDDFFCTAGRREVQVRDARNGTGRIDIRDQKQGETDLCAT